MDYEKLDEVASKLESKYIPESAKGNLEAKEILAITQAYRILKTKMVKIEEKQICDNCSSTDTYYMSSEQFCNNCNKFF